MLVGLRPALVSAAQSWLATADRAVITRGVQTSVQITVQNTSTTADANEAIGCVEIALPSSYSISGVRIDSVSNAKSWTISESNRTVTAAANADADRILGAPGQEVVVLTIDVISFTLSSANWAAAELNGIDCTTSMGTLAIPMEVVLGANTAPVASDDSATFSHDAGGTVAAPGVLANDTDGDGDALTAVLETAPANGSVSLAADGSYVYVPNAGYLGPDSFTYRASDGAVTTAPATVSITVVNATPTAADGTAPVSKNVTAAAPAPGVLALAADGDGDALSATLDGAPIHGTLTLAADGSWSYAPDPGYTGPDTFTWRATDGLASSAPATMTLQVANDAPLPVDDAYAMPGGLSLTVAAAEGLLANDSDPNGDGLTAAAVLFAPSHGTVAVSASGAFTYVPEPLYRGLDTFTYEACDGTACASATVTIDVGNNAPTAAADAMTTPRDQSLAVAAPGVLANDGDADGDALTAVLASGASSGSLALAADGSFTYAPNAGFTGTDTFTYRASDGSSQSAPATVTITVTGSPPVADDDDHATHAGTRLTVTAPGVLVGDTDADGDPLTAQLSSGPSNGTLTLRPDGSFDYTPDPAFLGTDAFWYVADDGTDASSPAKVRLAVTDTAPAGTADAWTTPHATTLVVAAPGVLANDDDPDPEDLVLTAVLAAGPASGSLSLADDGSFAYTPAAGFSGNMTFEYRVSSRTLVSAPVVVTVRVATAATPEPDPTPSPTPDPTATGEPSPTPGPTVEPTPTATPSPSPTDRGGAVPGPTAGPPDGSGSGGGDTFTVELGGGSRIDGAVAAMLGGLSGLFAWAVPALVLTVPGLLLIVAVAAQAVGGLAWLPIARRSLRGDGRSGRRRRSRQGGLIRVA